MIMGTKDGFLTKPKKDYQNQEAYSREKPFNAINSFGSIWSLAF